jgi:hypothetical protein
MDSLEIPIAVPKGSMGRGGIVSLIPEVAGRWLVGSYSEDLASMSDHEGFKTGSRFVPPRGNDA